MGTEIDINIDWTPNQWRRFLGQADATPLVEVISIMSDKIALHLIDRHLAGVDTERDDPSTVMTPMKDFMAFNHDE